MCQREIWVCSCGRVKPTDEGSTGPRTVMTCGMDEIVAAGGRRFSADASDTLDLLWMDDAHDGTTGAGGVRRGDRRAAGPRVPLGMDRRRRAPRPLAAAVVRDLPRRVRGAAAPAAVVPGTLDGGFRAVPGRRR